MEEEKKHFYFISSDIRDEEAESTDKVIDKIKEIAKSCLFGFMEGSVVWIEELIKSHCKEKLGFEPDFVQVNNFNPYKEKTKEPPEELKKPNSINIIKGYYWDFPIIVISIAHKDRCFSLVRDCQSEIGNSYDEDEW